jgi:hypothetical protein
MRHAGERPGQTSLSRQTRRGALAVDVRHGRKTAAQLIAEAKPQIDALLQS